MKDSSEKPQSETQTTEPTLIMFTSEGGDEPTSQPAGYVKAPVDAADLIERLGRLNRKQRRTIIARARKQARAANKGQKS